MKEVYEQVIITCTTINVITVISYLTAWIVDKIVEHRRKKTKQNNK